MELTFDIIDYMGKKDDGIFVLINLNIDNVDFYEAIFYYKENLVALTVDEKFEELIGCEIEDFPGYNDLMVGILSRLIPYEEALNITNEI
jgi:hypothetical protein